MKKNSFGGGTTQHENSGYGWGLGNGVGYLRNSGHGDSGARIFIEQGYGWGDGVRNGNGNGTIDCSGWGWGDGIRQKSNGDGWDFL